MERVLPRGAHRVVFVVSMQEGENIMIALVEDILFPILCSLLFVVSYTARKLLTENRRLNAELREARSLLKGEVKS